MIIKVKITPKSKVNKIIEFENDLLKIKIKAIPEKGKANVALIDFLSETFSIAKSNIKILSGSQAKIKLIQIDNLSQEIFNKIINDLIDK